MSKSTFSSDSNIYDGDEAYQNALDKIELSNHLNIILVEEFSDYCDECGDYHFYCVITVEVSHNTPTDLEVKLRKALNL